MAYSKTEDGKTMEEFLWTYDQFQRYVVLKEFRKIFYQGDSLRVLDVGGLSPDRDGKRLWLPLKHVISGNTTVLDTAYFRDLDYIQGDGKNLPFKDGAFTIVSALDVLEHIPEKTRGNLIRELCRVSKGAVVICAPFQDDSIARVEGLLFSQIKKLYGLKHIQYSEHRRYGLPKKEFISQFLDQSMNSGVNFSYGSLGNWLFNQTIKNCFLFRKNSRKIHSHLDRWMIVYPSVSELTPPFSRHFWLYSKDIGQKELEQGVQKIKENLSHNKGVTSDFTDLERLNREIVTFYTKNGFLFLFQFLMRPFKTVYYKLKLRFFSQR
jgi:hypothetical protein